MKTIYWRLLPLLFLLLLVMFFWHALSRDPRYLPSTQLGKPLPLFQLPVLNKPTEFLTPKTMQGHVVLLNVWASWCAACTEEQVFLLQLARQGVSIYGLNYKDNAEDAEHWLTEWGNPYKMSGQDIDGRAAIDLGVYGAPETFLIDQMGVIRYRHVGILDAKSWEHDFLPRIKALESAR